MRTFIPIFVPFLSGTIAIMASAALIGGSLIYSA